VFYNGKRAIWGDAEWAVSCDSKECIVHKWKKTELIYTIVYDCEDCGVKREEWEAKRKIKDDPNDPGNWF